MTLLRLPSRPATHVAISCLLAASSLALGGCFRHAEVVTTIPNPMTAGGVAPNDVQHQHASSERQRRIPAGSLTDNAQLTRMDTQDVCFDVSLRAVDEGNGQTWTDFRNWETSLLVDNYELVQPSIQMQQPVHQQYQGRVRQEVVVGEEQVCVDDNGNERNDVTEARPCTRWQTRPMTENQWVPGIVTVTTGTGQVCFQNQGHITAQSQRITLKMERRLRRLDFTWELQ